MGEGRETKGPELARPLDELDCQVRKGETKVALRAWHPHPDEWEEAAVLGQEGGWGEGLRAEPGNSRQVKATETKMASWHLTREQWENRGPKCSQRAPPA